VRWLLWLVSAALLLAVSGSTAAVRWDLVLLTVLTVGLLGVGYGARHRCRTRLLYHRGGEDRPRAVHAAARADPTGLRPHERRWLRAIERALEDEDPEFAERLRRTPDLPGHRADGRLTAVAVFGVVLVVVGLLSDPPLALIGLLITVSAFGVRLLLSARRPQDPAAGPDDEPPHGHDRGAPV